MINVKLLMPIVVKVKTRTQGENNSDIKKKDRQSFSLLEPQRLRDESEMEIPNQDFPSWEGSVEFELRE